MWKLKPVRVIAKIRILGWKVIFSLEALINVLKTIQKLLFTSPKYIYANFSQRFSQKLLGNFHKNASIFSQKTNMKFSRIFHECAHFLHTYKVYVKSNAQGEWLKNIIDIKMCILYHFKTYSLPTLMHCLLRSITVRRRQQSPWWRRSWLPRPKSSWISWASEYGLSAPSSALGIRWSWQGPGQARKKGAGRPGRPPRHDNPGRWWRWIHQVWRTAGRLLYQAQIII